MRDRDLEHADDAKDLETFLPHLKDHMPQHNFANYKEVKDMNGLPFMRIMSVCKFPFMQITLVVFSVK